MGNFIQWNCYYINHCGLVTPYGDFDLIEYWIKLKGISLEAITSISLKIAYLNFIKVSCPYSGANTSKLHNVAC